MDPASLEVLQAASRVLNSDNPPAPDDVEILTEFARTYMPERQDLPADELATFVAMKLMDVPGDPSA
jgi:hypothetical protein